MTRARTFFLHCLWSPELWAGAFGAEVGGILVLSAIPSIGNGANGGCAAHIFGYAVLSCTAGILLLVKNVDRPLLKGGLVTLLFGCMIECMQCFIPYRSCEAADIAVNAVATGIGMAGARLIQLMLFRRP